MKKCFFWGTMAIVLLITSCEKEDSGKTYENAMMDIADAEMLVIYQDGQETHKSTGNNDYNGNLFKLTIAGLEQVRFSIDDGTSIAPEETNVFVDNIMQLDDQVLLFSGNFSFGETEYGQILVRKTDGAIFDFSGVHVNHGSSSLSLNGSPFQKDASGKIYFKGDIIDQEDTQEGVTPSADVSERVLIRLDIADIENPSYENIQPTGQVFSKYTVDNNGNVYYMDESSPSQEIKVIQNSGGIIVLEGQVSLPWKGVNGTVYTFIENGIYTLEVEADEVVKTKVWENPDQEFGGAYSTYGFRVNKENSVLFISSDGSENGSSSTDMVGKSWEFNEAGNTLVEVEAPLNPGEIVQTDEYVYMYGGSKLYKMQLSDNTFIDISSGEYEFYTFGAGADNELIFSALRYSDGKKVTGKITASDQIEIIDEESNREATNMVRLN